MQRRNRILHKISIMLLLFSSLNLLSAGQPLSAAAEESAGEAWRYSKQIVIPGQAAYYELYLDPEVYRGAAEDLRDLRIVDNTGKYVPFYRESGEERPEEHNITYSATLVHSAKKGGSTLFDYRITPLAENTDIQGNRLEFKLPAENFLLHVQLLGSYDGVAWEPVAKGDLYAVDGREQNSIELGSTYKFSYYRLVAEKNAADLQFPALTLQHSNRVIKAELFKQQQEAAYEIQEEDKRTEIIIHNDDRLRVSGLQLESSGSFTRRYELYDGEGRVIPVTGTGELYRLDFKDTEITSTAIVPVKASSSPILRIVIHNQDDAPIALSGLKLEYLLDRIVFAADGAQPYRLLYGNAEAAAPQYDIVNFKDYIAGEDRPLARLGAAELQQVPEAAITDTSWFQGRLGFNIVIIAVSLILILFLARKLGRK
ncbi:hypothetical protein PAECIP111892_03148 [Paenibacillus auburnensis]|uniref:DUF3999 domain-containing protein n=1 Tax=Paenibacillus auburnensis TaxID=2905649 RepID=A0ABN8GIR8_9BACL|nr:hypothetical protein PAECIP111892_03148 [Paenibacillus auburnensis]